MHMNNHIYISIRGCTVEIYWRTFISCTVRVLGQLNYTGSYTYTLN